jgi:hypothetical protein
MDNFLSICLGIGLSAACGFRVFVPLLVMSIASLAGHMAFSPGFQWIGTYPALTVFATASVLEVTAYYIPWVDNLTDSIAGPAAFVAGVLVAASSIIHMDPLLKWTLALIAGGGTAAIFHGSTALLRGTSTALTGGITNHAVSTAELGLAAGLSILAIALPLVSIVMTVSLFLFLTEKGIRKLLRSRHPNGALP